MDGRAIAVVEAERHVVPLSRWNWGLIVALASCLAFWASVALGAAVVL